MVTPGNEMKWDTTEPSNGSYNFGPGDQIVSWAKSHSDRVRGHNLVWHSQLPSWVSNLPLNQVQGVMESHITTEATHYKGQVYAWDVVNEPFNDDGSLRQDVFDKAMGTGYIADALRTAHAADPNAKLYLNDYNIEGENAKSNALYSLAQSLLSQGVPLNGIGFESHFILGQVPSDMQANMQRFANLGLDVAVTELDDRIQLPASSSNLQQQATDYADRRQGLPATSPAASAYRSGASSDADSWIPGTFPGYGRGHHVRPELPAQARLQRDRHRPRRVLHRRRRRRQHDRCAARGGCRASAWTTRTRPRRRVRRCRSTAATARPTRPGPTPPPTS